MTSRPRRSGRPACCARPSARPRWEPRAGRSYGGWSSRRASSRTGCGCTASCSDGSRRVIVVSHRGPYSFGRDDDGKLIAHRGAGGIAGALGPLLADETSVTWIAAAISDDDRAAAQEGNTGDLAVDLHLLDLDREQHRMHYDVVANGVLWFLHHGIFDRTRRPRFDLRFRDAWDAFVAVNQSFTDAVLEHAASGEVVLVQDYQLTLVAGQLRALRPDRSVQEHRAGLSRIRPAPGSASGLAGPGRVRCDGLSVPPGPGRVPRIRERGGTGSCARERSLGDSRLAADRVGRPRRLRPLRCGHG